MTYLIQVKPSNLSFRVNEGETVLDAAIRHEYYFPHSCRYGVCGTCKGKLLSGEIDYDGVELFGLEPGEEEQGYALFCSAKPLSDLVIEVDGVRPPWDIATQELIYHPTKCQKLSGNVYLLMLKPEENQEPLNFRAGQYLELQHIAGHASPFSIANAPSSGDYLELHIRYSDRNPDTTEIIKKAENKESFDIKAPFGHCIFRKENKKPILFLAEGTGFAPMKSMIEERLSFGDDTPMHLFWYGKTEDDLYLDNLAKRWARHVMNFEYTPIVAADIMPKVLNGASDLSIFQVYAAGSEQWVLQLYKKCLAQGLDKECFYSDWLAVVIE